ncbi:MAG: adenylosuccinate synthetase [Patescibacteria group bacterium]|jgi:adenylosuccinate synthase
MKVDIIVDLVFGDSGKGCVSSSLLQKNKYDYCVKPNGSSNAGHTIIINGEKIVTHLIPAGVLHGIKSIIGPCCVMNVDKFLNEVKYLEEKGYNCRELIKVAYNAHIVTDIHIEEDSKDIKIGTTKQGNGPAYRDKYNRTGIRAESIPELKPFLVDIYEELFSQKNNRILFENSQGFGLDIDHGVYYPYVTSSSCGVGAVTQTGIPPKSVRNIYGVCKAYITYVGAMKFQPDFPILNKIQEVGKEYGATTGRVRQCDFMDLDQLNKAIDINGVNILVINKMDILNEVGVWGIYRKGECGKYVNFFKNEKEFKKYLKKNIRKGVKIMFSYSPDKI